MSVDDIRVQKGLALLEHKEASDEVSTLSEILKKIASELRTLAGLLDGAPNIAQPPARLASLCPESFSTYQQLTSAQQRLEAAKNKLEEFNL